MSSEYLDRIWDTAISRVISFLPTVFATALLLLLGWLVSMLLAGIAKRLMRRLDLDERIRGSGLEDPLAKAGLDKPTSYVMARLVFWLVFLSFVVLALQNLGLQLSELPIRNFVAYVPLMIGALILLIAGFLLATFLGRACSAGLARAGVAAHQRLGLIVQWILIALTVVITVDQLGFDVTLLTDTFSNLLTIIAAGLALAFAWGGREVARNVLAGYYVKEHFTPGDVLSFDGHEGRLEETGSLNSRLSTPRGSIVVPNSRLVEQTVETRSEEQD